MGTHPKGRAGVIGLLASAMLVAGSGEGASAQVGRGDGSPLLDTGCTNEHPTPLNLVPEGKDESTLVASLVACTGPRGGVYLKNNHSEVVWLIDQPKDLKWDLPPIFHAVDAEVILFRQMLEQVNPGGLSLEPETAVVIRHHPSVIHLSLSGHLQGAWQTLVAVWDTIEDKTFDGFAQIVARRSAARQAMLTCVKVGYDIGRDAAKSPEPAKFLLDGFTAGGECAEAIRQAEEAAPEHRLPVTIEEVAVHAKKPEGGWLARTRQWLRQAASLAARFRP